MSPPDAHLLPLHDGEAQLRRVRQTAPRLARHFAPGAVAVTKELPVIVQVADREDHGDFTWTVWDLDCEHNLVLKRLRIPWRCFLPDLAEFQGFAGFLASFL